MFLLAVSLFGASSPTQDDSGVSISCKIDPTSQDDIFTMRADVRDPSVRAIGVYAVYGDGSGQFNTGFHLAIKHRKSVWVGSTRGPWRPPDYHPAAMNRAWGTVTATFDADGNRLWKRPFDHHPLDLYDPTTLY